MKKKYRYRGCRGRMKKRISCNATIIFDLREKFEKIINEQDKILAAISCVTPAAGRVDELVFFGGEPLLCRDLVLKTASWCRKEHPGRFAISLTTNGTLVDREYASAAKALEIERQIASQVSQFSEDGSEGSW